MKNKRLHRFPKQITQIILALLLAVTCLLFTAYAAVPHLINYQGRLTDSSGTPLTGSYTLTFKIYDSETGPGTMTPWEETHSGVVIQKGLFNVLLGSVTPLNLAFDKPYFLEIKVGNEVMSPRQTITSSGYAIRAENVEIAEKIKADSGDTSPGYLSDKVDNTTIKVNTSTHKLSAMHGSQMFTSSGTFTAPAGITTVYLTMVGGGGGGGGGWNEAGGGGGGSGGYVIKYPYTVVAGNNYTITVNRGGIGGSPIMAGSAGGSVIFDTLTINGGSGGIGGQARGAGGAAGGGLNGNDASGETAGAAKVFNGLLGGAGGDGNVVSLDGGGGAASMAGNGGTGAESGNNNGGNGTGYGAGGGGGGGGSGAGHQGSGGNGSNGYILVEW